MERDVSGASAAAAFFARYDQRGAVSRLATGIKHKRADFGRRWFVVMLDVL